MQDEGTTSTEPTPPEDEQAEALSRAARQAVRQPADPRLERSFAKLGLFADEETIQTATSGSPADPTPSDPPAPSGGPIAATVDLEPLHGQLARLQASVEAVERRVGRLTSIAIGLVVATGAVLVLVLIRA